MKVLQAGTVSFKGTLQTAARRPFIAHVVSIHLVIRGGATGRDGIVPKSLNGCLKWNGK